MRVVIQRVSQASVSVHNETLSEIGSGLLVLLGIEAEDNEEDIHWLCRKITQLRVFDDAEGVMNKSLVDINGEVLLISQFTLHASTKKGNRPSYTKAAKPDIAEPLYLQFCDALQAALATEVKTGRFGADMKVCLINDGPVTIIIDSKNKQ